MNNINAPYDVESVREDFPILERQVRGKDLIYFDNAATTLKPNVVSEAVLNHYRMGASNIHRGVHQLSEDATMLFEGTRSKMQKFLNAGRSEEIIFTSGTTAGINLIAKSYGRSVLKKGDEILISYMEHHSNIVPWQMLCEEIGCVLKVVPMNQDGEMIMEEFDRLLTPKTKIVSIVYISNALGTINPIKTITDMAHKKGAVVVVDAAQAVAHVKIDVQTLGCDFLVLSSHKLFGPTGVGVLYGRNELLAKMPPLMGGGDMIETVSFEKTTYAKLPNLHEAGTPDIAGVIGLGAAIDFVRGIGLKKIAAYEAELLDYGTKVLEEVEGLKLIGTAKKKASVLAFTLDGVHPHDIGSCLDMDGIAIRAGHHCAQPVMQFYGLPATARASLSIYNKKEELDALAVSLKKIREMFA
jgi:cysteine desulfurase / selenocysteine lyase